MCVVSFYVKIHTHLCWLADHAQAHAIRFSTEIWHYFQDRSAWSNFGTRIGANYQGAAGHQCPGEHCMIMWITYIHVYVSEVCAWEYVCAMSCISHEHVNIFARSQYPGEHCMIVWICMYVGKLCMRVCMCDVVYEGQEHVHLSACKQYPGIALHEYQ